MSEARDAIEVFRRTKPGAAPWGHPAVRAMFAAHRPDAVDDILRELATELPNPDDHCASRVAIACGTMVEEGGDPAIAGLAIVERIRKTRPPYDPEVRELFDRGAMAHLCRSLEVRGAARRQGGVEEDAAPWTHTVLSLVDDLELLVLAPEYQQGWRVRLEAVRTCAHLFTLLQAALIPPLPGEPVDPKVLALATGEQPMTEALVDHQRFRFDDWTSLAGPTTLAPGLGGFLPVDLSPAAIPALPDGRRVVLLGQPQLGGRSWDSAFFANLHDALRSRVEVLEVLGPDAVRAELSAILSVRAR